MLIEEMARGKTQRRRTLKRRRNARKTRISGGGETDDFLNAIQRELNAQNVKNATQGLLKLQHGPYLNAVRPLRRNSTYPEKVNKLAYIRSYIQSNEPLLKEFLRPLAELISQQPKESRQQILHDYNDAHINERTAFRKQIMNSTDDQIIAKFDTIISTIDNIKRKPELIRSLDPAFLVEKYIETREIISFINLHLPA